MKLRILMLVLVGAAGVGASIALADSGKHGRHTDTSTIDDHDRNDDDSDVPAEPRRRHRLLAADLHGHGDEGRRAQLVRAGPGRDRHGRRRGPDRAGQRGGLRHRIGADRPRGRGARHVDEAVTTTGTTTTSTDLDHDDDAGARGRRAPRPSPRPPLGRLPRGRPRGRRRGPDGTVEGEAPALIRAPPLCSLGTRPKRGSGRIREAALRFGGIPADSRRPSLAVKGSVPVP